MSLDFKQSRIWLIAVCLIFALISILSFNIPFFWDNVRVVSQAASYILEQKFTSLILPEYLDSGHAPFIALYFAIMWSILGKSLLVSHIVMIPFVLGLIWEFYKLSKQFLEEKFIKVALLLLLLEPVLMTQTILMGYDIIVGYFFMASINCLHRPKRIKLIIFLSFLLLTNLRGIPLVFSVFLIHGMVYRKDSIGEFFKKNILLYLLAVIAASVWYGYHYGARGWLFMSPAREVQRQINSANMMFRQSIYIIWKLADYGKIIFWSFILISTFKYFKQEIMARKLSLFLLIPVVCLSVTMIPFSNPIGHKYFLPIYLLLVLVMTYHLQFLKSNTTRIGAIILFCIISFAGNFIMYPERFGNGWDTSLKVLSYFPLQDKMDECIIGNKINPKEVAVSFPMFEDHRYTKLSEGEFAFSDIDNKPLNQWSYIIISNISNSYSDQLKAEIRSNWKLLTEYKSGLVYLQLYHNPAL